MHSFHKLSILAQSFSRQGRLGSQPPRLPAPTMGRKQRGARGRARARSQVKSPGTPPVKLSEVEQENLEETTNRKPSLGNEASSSSSTSAREDNTHLDTIAKVMVGTKETRCKEGSRVGGGSDVRGLYNHQDYGINPRRTNGKRQSSRFPPSGPKGFEAFAGWPDRLRKGMRNTNA